MYLLCVQVLNVEGHFGCINYIRMSLVFDKLESSSSAC